MNMAPTLGYLDPRASVPRTLTPGIGDDVAAPTGNFWPPFVEAYHVPIASPSRNNNADIDSNNYNDYNKTITITGMNRNSNTAVKS